MSDRKYAGFWIRTGAALIDTVLIMIFITPFLVMIYGAEYFQGNNLYNGFWDVMFNYVFPGIVIVLFWVYKSATPGKMVLKLQIVDALTGGKPSTKQLIGRYFAYYVSMIPLMLGFIWIIFDKQKQGWHDKLAGTLVIRKTEESG